MKLTTMILMGAVAFCSANADAGMSTRLGVKEGDVNVGVDAMNKLGIIFDGHVQELEEINGPLFGFGLDEPGIIGIENPQPDVGLVPLANGAHLVLQVILFDPALQGWTPGFASTFMNPGDQWDVSGVPVHEHPFWQINSQDPGYVPPPLQTEWHATFRLLDTGSTGYAASDPVTVTFTPEPVSVALMACAGVLALSRRPRRK